MHQRFMQVLQSEEGTDAQNDVLVRRFWARAKALPAPPRLDAGPARVVDLASWIRTRRAER